jgi:hypothetical protein
LEESCSPVYNSVRLPICISSRGEVYIVYHCCCINCICALAGSPSGLG